MTGNPSITLVELVNDDGATVGVAEKLFVHRPPGQLHRAFSVFLVDEADRVILQRRALTKYHSPGVWSNTCCGHPLPAEAPVDAAVRRVGEELGPRSVVLVPSGTVSYRHVDDATGLVEREFNHLFLGRVELGQLRPDAGEVAQVTAVTAPELDALRASEPFSSWFSTVFEAVRPQLARLAGDGAW